jgi:alkylation response protein AidB-like acyl-CoA dehydrogenase
MDLDLSEQHRLFRDTVREFAEGEIAPVAEELDRSSRFPLDELRKAADLGLLGIPFPEEYGGTGADTLSYALAIEELGRIDSSFAITVAAHTSLGTSPIYLFGDERQKREWLPPLASGERLAAFGLTEPEAGSDAGATRTRARLDGGEWVIDGAKMFITNAGTPVTACVTITARTGEDEVSNIVVFNGTDGYEVGPPLKKMGWKASDTRPLSFDGCRVPEGNLLGPRGKGFAQFLEILDGGRISVAALGLGLAQGAYEQALSYARERQQFGRPIARFQAVQFMLADMAIAYEATRLLCHKAAAGIDAGRPDSIVSSYAKAYGADAAMHAATDAVQIFGGYGYTKEYPVEKLMRDAKLLQIYEGTSQIQRMVIARHVLGG